MQEHHSNVQLQLLALKICSYTLNPVLLAQSCLLLHNALSIFCDGFTSFVQRDLGKLITIPVELIHIYPCATQTMLAKWRTQNEITLPPSLASYYKDIGNLYEL